MIAPAARVLVVEDEALILMAALDMLRELGHEPLPARCAAAAIALFERDPKVDVLRTDVNMPDMDGQQLAAEMRRRHPGLPVIFATGYRLNLVEAVASGPTTVVGKPYRTRDLADALRKVLGNAAAEA